MDSKNDLFKLYLDRQDEGYQKMIADLLSYESLRTQAIEEKGDGYDKLVKIKFCGLSSLTLLGGADFHNAPRNKATLAFKALIKNENNIIKNLNDEKIGIEIKFLFAHPYSDFVYDLVQAELSEQTGISMTCVHNNIRFKHSFSISNKLTYSDLKQSPTYLHLTNSLYNLQVNAQQHLFNLETKEEKQKNPNRLIVKFTPLSILSCLLKINNNIFIDPYVYAKEFKDTKILSLKSPVTRIIDSAQSYENDINYKLIHDHYCSIISHFRYLWEHPLTLYCKDATRYKKGNGGLSDILEPNQISFHHKSLRIKNRIKDKEDVNDAEIDLWKQYCKKDFLQYTSKFTKYNNPVIDELSNRHIKLKPIQIFIVGSWVEGRQNQYMTLLEKFINNKFKANSSGMILEAVIVKVANGKELQREIYQNLNNSQLAFVLQTQDIKINENEYLCRPNVYLEKGYLMKHLGKHIDHKGQEREKVFVLRQSKVSVESDNHNFGYTNFTDEKDFDFTFPDIIDWIWNLTELNNNVALKYLEHEKKNFEKKIKKIEKDISKNIDKEYNIRQMQKIKEEIIPNIEKYMREVQKWMRFRES